MLACGATHGEFKNEIVTICCNSPPKGVQHHGRIPLHRCWVLKESVSKTIQQICRCGHPAGICFLFKTLPLRWCPSRPEAILDQLVTHMWCRHPGIMASGCLLAAGGAGKLASRPLCKHPKSDQSLVGIHAACSTRPYRVHEVMLSAASRCINAISGKLWQALWTNKKNDQNDGFVMVP